MKYGNIHGAEDKDRIKEEKEDLTDLCCAVDKLRYDISILTAAIVGLSQAINASD